jgi:hypothetical protein
MEDIMPLAALDRRLRLEWALASLELSFDLLSMEPGRREVERSIDLLLEAYGALARVDRADAHEERTAFETRRRIARALALLSIDDLERSDGELELIRDEVGTASFSLERELLRADAA